MMKKRILHILPNFRCGGAERMAVQLMQNLDFERFEVAAISLYDRVCSDLEIMLEQCGIPVWYLGKRLGFDPRMYYLIDKVFRRFSPDIVHTHLYVMRYTLPSLLLRRIKGKVHTVHSLANKEVDLLGKFVHRLAFQSGVVPVAIAIEVARSLANVYGVTNPSLITNGIPIQKYSASVKTRSEWRMREGIGEEEVVFVSVGSFSKPKNQQLLLEAFARVSDALKNGQLVLAGDGKKRHELQMQAETLGISHRVRFLGVRTDIPDILGACDVFVLSSDWEGNPLSVMEAMAAGKPVISTDVGGVPELVLDGITGKLVAAGDTAALSQALFVLYRDPLMREQMGRAGSVRAEEKFCIKVMTKKYEDLYERLLV